MFKENGYSMQIFHYVLLGSIIFVTLLVCFSVHKKYSLKMGFTLQGKNTFLKGQFFSFRIRKTKDILYRVASLARVFIPLIKIIFNFYSESK